MPKSSGALKRSKQEPFDSKPGIKSSAGSKRDSRSVTRLVRFGEPASDEFRDAVEWYESRRLGLGADFFDAVVTAIDAIHAHPEIGTQRSSDGKTRRVLLEKFPYQVVYRLRPEEVAIVAIAHLKRRPNYWKDRG